MLSEVNSHASTSTDLFLNLLILFPPYLIIRFLFYFLRTKISISESFKTPLLILAIDWKAFLLKSIVLPFTNGPLSFILTTTDFPLVLFTTFTLVPNGKLLCAAVN